MDNISLWHWVIVLGFLVVYLVPLVMIIRKAGYNGWWILLLFVPLVNIIMLWVFAFADWPSQRGGRA
jgi:hypothetical protein